MSDLKGTNLVAPIVPFTTDDNYPTHLAIYGKGGFRSVKDMKELESIPPERREEGMIVYVLEDPDDIHVYQLVDNSWVMYEGVIKTKKINDITDIL